MPRTNYLQQHFWIKTPIPFFKLFDNEAAKNNVLISCFNAKPVNFNMFGDKKKWIFYSGERFMTEANSNIIIGFLPTNTTLLDYILNKDLKSKYSGLLINEVNLATSKYQYNMKTNIKSINDLLQPLIDNKVFYIQLKDQERFQLELLFAKKGITTLTKDLIAEISLYTDLNTKWHNYYDKYNGLTHEQLLECKPKFACFIVSNPKCWERNKMFDMLQIISGQQVDSMGKFKRNVDIIIPDRETQQDDYFKLIEQYRFMITFENHSLPWYNTEKIFNAFASGTIPIYWGDPLITEVYNSSCFVHIPTFEDKTKQTGAIIKGCEMIKSIEADLENSYKEFFRGDLMVNAEAEDIRLRENVESIYNVFHI